MRPQSALAALAALILLLVAACGSDDQPPPEATSDREVAAPTAEGAATPTPEEPSPTPTPQPTSTPVAVPTSTPVPVVDLATYSWQQITDDAAWGGRAGLRIAELEGSIYLFGGRTPRDSTLPGDSDIFSDVWRSDDLGATWELLLESGGSHWAPRAYFQSVVNDGFIYVLGGQDFGLEENPFCALLEQGLEPPPGLGIDPDAPCPEFLPTSEFFNDVWRSADGVTWELMTADAPWAPRAGLSAAVLDGAIYVMGGSQNDDSSIIGPNGPERIYYDDVWRSVDGTEWELVSSGDWAPRAGASVVTGGDHIWLFGGEDGFTCTPLPDCEAPYFNDVWTLDSAGAWTEVSGDAAWSPRPGHQCEPVGVDFVCFGGFGLIENPTDVWSTRDGVDWTLLADAPWNAEDPDLIKYDFDSIVIDTDDGPIIMTAGGDRETFDFTDPENYLRVDDDVWVFAPS